MVCVNSAIEIYFAVRALASFAALALTRFALAAAALPSDFISLIPRRLFAIALAIVDMSMPQ